ncbi:cytidine deaminase [Neoactinobaculum massilliense]|uniref:cytidine deaminase n=1 Tax=Neoactinobaculum massilliense TaxID=2364794 RepID=UPI000F54B111|nr:cytidine deaminase [Neoactinobaculum massilliense]
MTSNLLSRARAAAHHAYVPYSHFAVGAAVRTTTGDIFIGCNVENAALGETICAERNAVTTAVAQLGPEMRVDTIAIVGLGAAPCWPCGACRQVLREFGVRRVLVENEKGQPAELSLEDLLPRSFGPDALA